LGFDLALEAYGRRFDINDAGFLKRANFVHPDATLGWKDTTPGDMIRESETAISASYRGNWAGQRIGGNYALETKLVLASYWKVGGKLAWKPAYFDDREVGDGTALERAGHPEVEL